MTENIKIFCLKCCEYIMDTSSKFVVGGPYHGEMFKRASDNDLFRDYFHFERWVTDGNLYCPRCHSSFINDVGELLTEHGRVKTGQQTIDRSDSVIYHEGEFKNRLKWDSHYSRELDRRGPVGEFNPFVTGSIRNPDREKPEDPAADMIGEAISNVVSNKPEELVFVEKKRILTCKKCCKEISFPAAHRKGCG